MNSKPKVLVISSTYPRWRGDVEPGFVHELNRRLTACFDMHVLSPHAEGALALEVLDGVTVHRFRYCIPRLETLICGGGIAGNLRLSPWKWVLVPFFLLSMSLALVWHVKRLRPACVHVHWIIPQGIALLWASAFVRMPPVLLTSHGGDIFGFKGAILSALKKVILRRASAVGVVSGTVWDAAIKLGVDPEKMAVLPMGVDLSTRFIPNPLVGRAPSRMLFVGRLVEKKGLIHLIECLPKVLQRLPSAHLDVVGDGPEMIRLRRRVSELGMEAHVSFLGSLTQRELPALYQRASLFVAPFIEAKSGDQEGLGLVTIEALGCGCPVLLGRVDAISDILDGNEYIVSRVADTEEFSAKIVESLMNTPALVNATKELRESVIARFDWANAAHGYEQLLSSLLAGVTASR